MISFYYIFQTQVSESRFHPQREHATNETIISFSFARFFFHVSSLWDGKRENNNKA